MKIFLFLVFIVFFAEGAYKGNPCESNGEAGICKNLYHCPTAIDDIKHRRQPPTTCGWEGNDVIVCCRNATNVTTTKKPVLTTTPRAMGTTTEYIPQEYDYEVIGSKNKAGQCEPIPPVMTSEPKGQKAWDKCIEYQEKYVFPCEQGTALSGDYGRVNHCHHNSDELIPGGTIAAGLEFPHMVLLGYANELNNITWECGGSLISERFVLTAGHCIANKLRNNVSHALIGSLKRSEEADSKRFGIKRIIKHDNYHSPYKYNDIALLELDKEVPLDHNTVPACLHTGEAVDDSRASATGWGAATVYNKDSNSDVLQKVVLTKFTSEECSDTFKANSHMKDGVDEKSQFCYGDRTQSKDTCQGDSGGPLQIKSKKIICMYTIIGVTSFGQACGWAGVPGIYTRVSNYLPWIESVVWPN